MWPFTSAPRIEDPDRLKRFLDKLENASWRSSPATALEIVFSALNELIYHEVRFYYTARKRQRLFSIFTRGLAVVLGTAGVIIPLLAAADPNLFKVATPYGYPLLVAAAASLTVNRMFGATGGHIRYVTAQLELERIIAKFRLAWWDLISQSTLSNDQQRELAFKLMNAFVDDAYRVIQEETVVWGQSISEAIREYEKRLPSEHGVDAPKTH